MNTVQNVKQKTITMTIKNSNKPKKAGRPARLSREKILDTAIALLKSGDFENFSIRRIAQELSTVPGNLYTYFPDKQALMNAIGEQAFASLRFSQNESLSWDAQIESWMQQVHDLLVENQDLILLMGITGTSAESLQVIDSISRLLQQQGFDAPQAVLHAQSLYWNVMSFSLFEIQASDKNVIEQLTSTGQNSKHADLLDKLALENPAPLWRVNLQRNLDGLRFQVSKL
jgi:AcrR family transcriptional regulator